MDHLVFGVPDLEQGIDLVERRTGVRAEFGGKHPGRGTHNALLSFGNRQYLEIIAIDPEQPSTAEVMFAGLRELKEPRFVSWAVAVPDVGEIARRAKAAGIATVGPLDGSRRQADGSMLEWTTLRLASELELAPFFIAWGKTTHPSETTPEGCRLLSFTIEHPKAEELRKLLAALGAEAHVRAGATPRLTTRLATPKGEVEL
jgi:Glyoxalase-like domain